jgi:predicted enzyme related to lactoylglutathione lyase
MSGRVVHFEIPFDDAERAQGFYRETFGWNLTSMPEMSYTMVQTGPVSEQGMPSEPGYIGGGMFARQDPLRNPVLVVDVEDIDATLKKIGELGGSTLRPKEPVGDMGWAAYFSDPEGNVIGVWQTARSS